MSAEVPSPAAAPTRKGPPKSVVMLGGAAVLALVLAGGGCVLTRAGKVSTDNAYVAVEVAQVTPLVGGPVRAVRVVDTQAVQAGQVLVELDDADARLAVAQAQAALAAAERRVRQLLANETQLAAQVDARGSTIARAEADLGAAAAEVGRLQAEATKAQVDYDRRRALSASGAVSEDELTNVETRLRAAQASLASARARQQASAAALAEARAGRSVAIGTRRANTVLIENTTIETHPEVVTARARLDQARLDLARTVVRAPVAGVVAQRAVEVGQRVQPGVRLMTVIPIQRAYVDANFKEDQLRRVRVGQPVRLTADLYGDEVVYTGRVAGIGGGTGSAFSLMPAQNATGNWIKVSQRLPVRISLDPAQLQQHPLRVGLSMRATVDVDARPDRVQVAAASGGVGR